MKKSLLKIQSTSLFINTFITIELGQLKLDVLHQIILYKDKDEKVKIDVEIIDYQNITYMGMEVNGYDGWNKLKEYHSSLGIDLSKEIDNAANKIITNKQIEYWAEKQFANQFEQMTKNIK